MTLSKRYSKQRLLLKKSFRSSARQERIRSSLSSSASTSSSSSEDRVPHKSHIQTTCGKWKKDRVCKRCGKCNKPFSLVVRKHHCRLCGEIFCSACSRTRMQLPESNKDSDAKQKRRRVCDSCALHAHNGAMSFETEGPVLDLLPSELCNLDTLRAKGTLISALSRLIRTHILFLFPAIFACSILALSLVKIGALYRLWPVWSGIFFIIVYCVYKASQGTKWASFKWSIKDPLIIDDEAAVSDISEHSESALDCDAQLVLDLSMQHKEKLIALSQDAIYRVIEMGCTVNGWQPETSVQTDASLFSRNAKPVSIYKGECLIDLAPDKVFDILYHQFEQNHTWNVTVAENRRLCVLDECTDVVHMTSAPAMGGLVTSRDFVDVRTWKPYKNGFVISSTCAGPKVIPTRKGITRGDNHLSGFVILPEGASQTRLISLLQLDIKGYFPSSMIKKGTLSEIDCYVRNLRQYIAKLSHAETLSA